MNRNYRTVWSLEHAALSGIVDWWLTKTSSTTTTTTITDDSTMRVSTIRVKTTITEESVHREFDYKLKFFRIEYVCDAVCLHSQFNFIHSLFLSRSFTPSLSQPHALALYGAIMPFWTQGCSLQILLENKCPFYSSLNHALKTCLRSFHHLSLFFFFHVSNIIRLLSSLSVAFFYGIHLLNLSLL